MKPDVPQYFGERFGIHKSHFKQFRLYTDQKGRALLGPKNLGPERIVISVGMQAATVSGAIKPSTNFLQLFGRHATKNFVSLTREQTQAYLKGEDHELNEVHKTATEGYVLLNYLDYPLAWRLLKGATLTEGDKSRLPTIVNVLAKP